MGLGGFGGAGPEGPPTSLKEPARLRHQPGACALIHLIYPVERFTRYSPPPSLVVKEVPEGNLCLVCRWLFRWGEGTSSERSTSRQHPDLTL